MMVGIFMTSSMTSAERSRCASAALAALAALASA